MQTGVRQLRVDWDGAMTGSGRWTRKPTAASRGTSLHYGHVILNICTLQLSMSADDRSISVEAVQSLVILEWSNALRSERNVI
jgi:hypothetical protein